MCIVLPQTKYPIKLRALGLDDPKVEIRVIREATSWSRYLGDRLHREGDHFVGEARLEPEDMFMLVVSGLDAMTAKRAFELRRASGLVAPDESFTFSSIDHEFFALITDNPQFKVSSANMPYPYNMLSATT